MPCSLHIFLLDSTWFVQIQSHLAPLRQNPHNRFSLGWLGAVGFPKTSIPEEVWPALTVQKECHQSLSPPRPPLVLWVQRHCLSNCQPTTSGGGMKGCAASMKGSPYERGCARSTATRNAKRHGSLGTQFNNKLKHHIHWDGSIFF